MENMIFRPYRDLLQESLDAKSEINIFDELLILINAPYFVQPLELSWIYQGFDKRINSDSYIICVKMKEYLTPQAVGCTHDNPEKLLGCKEYLYRNNLDKQDLRIAEFTC